MKFQTQSAYRKNHRSFSIWKQLNKKKQRAFGDQPKKRLLIVSDFWGLQQRESVRP